MNNDWAALILVILGTCLFLVPMFTLLIAEPGDEKRQDWFGALLRFILDERNPT